MAKLVRDQATRAPVRRSKTGDEPVTIAGVRLTHPGRALWPEQGLTKQDLARYYCDVADRLLPHIVDRPLTLVRCPGGQGATCFYQKHAWRGLSAAVTRASVPGEDGPQEVLTVRNIGGVIALVQAGVLELHPWGSTMTDVERPDRIVLDFDPGEGVAWRDVVVAAREARDRLSRLGLESFVKTTGGKGLHVVVPVIPTSGWDAAKAFAKGLADAMAADQPERYTTSAVKRERPGRIFIDYLRNTRGQTAVAPYSTRARPGAPVSTPLAWDELSAEIRSDGFRVDNLRQRLERLAQDPWAAFRTVRQALPAVEENSGRLR